MLIRGIIVLEGVLKEISPSISVVKILSTHAHSVKLLSKENMMNFVKNSVKNGTDLISIPNELLNFLKGVNSGELRFNIELNDSKHQFRNVEKMLHVVTILNVAFIIGTSLIVINNKEDLPFIFYIYLIFGCICTVWIFYKMFVSRLKKIMSLIGYFFIFLF